MKSLRGRAPQVGNNQLMMSIQHNFSITSVLLGIEQSLLLHGIALTMARLAGERC